MNINEQLTEQAFTGQSVIFDELYSGNTIVHYKRGRVRKHVLNLLAPGSTILELNSGTGDDAVFFARLGHYVHATDLSRGMQAQLRNKVQLNGLGAFVSNELCSYTSLQQLKNRGPFDHIFSNFAGLNCTGDLQTVLASFNDLLKPNGTVTLVMLPGFCLWETLLLFKGHFRTAFRRFFSKNGVAAKIDGNHFKCWYYQPGYVIKNLEQQFDLLALDGLCTLVPPSYIEGFAEKFPVVYRRLQALEERLKTTWPWNTIGDYYIISFRKR